MNLNLLAHENFATKPTYHILLLDSPYNSDGIGWIDCHFVKEHRVLRIDNLIFEALFEKVLAIFNYYNPDGITDFYEERSLSLLRLLKIENEEICQLSDEQLKGRYELIFSAILDRDNFKKEYDKSNGTELIRSDVQSIMAAMINDLEIAIRDKRSITIVGI